MIRADKNSPKLSALWGLPPSFTFTKKVPIIEHKIPVAARTRGKITNPIPASVLPFATNIADPSTIVAIIEPT